LATATVGIVGVLIGLVVGHILTGFREHTRWVNDQKRFEYRELLDQLYETVTIVTENRPNLSTTSLEPINYAVMKLARLFEDRLFIGAQLRRSGATDDWYAMKRVIYYDPQLQSVTPKEFWYTSHNLHEREDKLRQKIIKLAGEDIVAWDWKRP
jgi:hypothetical protein